MLQTRTCARARRALHEPPDRTSVRAARIHPSPALATVGWLGGGRRPPCGGGDTCNTSTPRFGVLDPSQRAARKDACAAPSTRPVPRHGSLVMQPPRRSCSGRISALTARDAWRATQTSKQQPSLLRLECSKRAPVLAHGVLYTSLPAARACGRLESTLPPPSPLLAGRWAPSALRRRRHLQHEHAPRFGALDPSQRAARKDAWAALSTRPVPRHGSF